MMINLFQEKFEQLQVEAIDLYQFLNQYRDWVNQSAANYEIFLEDNWFEDKTVIEYTFRCLDTLDVLVFAEDEYANHRDNKGVWHLGDYIKTCWTLENPWAAIEQFMTRNGQPRLKNSILNSYS